MLTAAAIVTAAASGRRRSWAGAEAACGVDGGGGGAAAEMAAGEAPAPEVEEDDRSGLATDSERRRGCGWPPPVGVRLGGKDGTPPPSPSLIPRALVVVLSRHPQTLSVLARFLGGGCGGNGVSCGSGGGGGSSTCSGGGGGGRGSGGGGGGGGGGGDSGRGGRGEGGTSGLATAIRGFLDSVPSVAVRGDAILTACVDGHLPVHDVREEEGPVEDIGGGWRPGGGAPPGGSGGGGGGGVGSDGDGGGSVPLGDAAFGLGGILLASTLASAIVGTHSDGAGVTAVYCGYTILVYAAAMGVTPGGGAFAAGG